MNNKNKQIERLEEELEELKKKQTIILGYGADDLDIRDEIADIEEQLNKLYK